MITLTCVKPENQAAANATVLKRRFCQHYNSQAYTEPDEASEDPSAARGCERGRGSIASRASPSLLKHDVRSEYL